MSFGARALIRLGALNHNLNVIKQRAPGASIMAVVKANAYGHGLTVVAGALHSADSLAVARLPEAFSLREAGISSPLVLLSGVYSSVELVTACNMGCELVVHNNDQLELLEAESGLNATVWLKIDTGMRRLGFPVEQAGEVIERLRRCEAVSELRLMTHLANADDESDPKTSRQLDRFSTIARNFEGDVSISNSGGIFGWPESVKPPYASAAGRVWIRPGIAMYGVSPFADKTGVELGLQAVMQFESRLIDIKPVRRGESVGYGGHWVAERDSVLGIVSAGYGDGYTRYLPSGTPVLINGRQVPIAGAVSMDMTAVDLGSGSQDKVGDSVVLWGDDLPVEHIAKHANTVPYQLVCGIMNREQSTIVD